MSYFFDLSEDDSRQIISALAPHLTESRKRRIQRVLGQRTKELVVVLEDVASAHNASAVMRTAEAFGVLEVHLIPSPSPFRLSQNVSSGAHKWLDVRQYTNATKAYKNLKQRGYAVWASSVHGEAKTLSEINVDSKIALVFGNEHCGLSAAARDHADGLFRIPTTGFVESLNISVAAAVSMHDVLRRIRAQRSLIISALEQRQLEAFLYARSLRSASFVLRQASLPEPRAPEVDWLFEA